MPLAFGTIPEPSGKQARTQATAGSQKESKALMMARLLQSGCSLKEAIAADPGYSLQNLMKMRTFASFCAHISESSQKAQWPSNLQYQGESLVTRRLVEWCNKNIGCSRPLHQQQLYLHGSTSMRKSTFLSILQFFSNSYAIPTKEDFYDLYQDPEPTLCYIDEYERKECKMLGWLKEFVQGTKMNLRLKGGQRMKLTNPAVVILSNYSLEFIYHRALAAHPEALDPIYKRFLVVEATEPIDNQGLIEALVSALLATTAPPSAETIQELRSLISNPSPTMSSSAPIIVPCNAPSQAIATSNESVSSVNAEQSSADADGTLAPVSSNSQVMSNQPETRTAFAERFMQERREKLRKEQDKVSSIDKITFKGNKRLFSGYNEDDHLLEQ